MCGIAGIRRFTPLASWGSTTTALIDRMTDVIAHRGPNDRGTWCDGDIALGHRRLSVIDLSSAGRQPMGTEDGAIQIVFNGEIYNFRELSDRYRLREGHVFRSRTDTEVLLHLFEELGPAMAGQLNGMFAFAIWDSRKRELHLARDPFGVKPLFYQQDGEYFRFGSEIKAILADPRVERRPSLQALHDFLSFDYVPGAQSAFEGIFEVPPGQWMTIDRDGRIISQSFWDPSFQVDESITTKQAAERARELMDTAVRRQLVADVPVGVMLSGGLDSSSLVALMDRHVSTPIHTYSVGFEDASFNELPYARIVAQRYKTIQREAVVTASSVRAMLPRYLEFIDEPYGDGSAIPTYYVCEAAKDDVVVVLSGEGGDEAFAGYDTYAAFKASQWWRRVPSVVRQQLFAPLIFRLPVSHKKLSLEFRLKRFMGGQDLTPEQAHFWWRVVLTEQQKMAIYSPRMRERMMDMLDPRRHFADWYARSGPTDTLARLMRIDTRVFLPDDLMIKNDRMSMAHSLEARVPFTDPELVDYLSTVPSRIKLPGLRKKSVMREAMSDLLPPTITNKKKVGLEIPYSLWFKNELRDLVNDYLSRERLLATGLFDADGVRTLVDAHLEGRQDHGRAIWGLLNYLMWLEVYMPDAAYV